MFGVGRGGNRGSLDHVEIVRSALELIAAKPDVASDLDRIMILRILSLLYDNGIEDPQRLANAASLLASSKLFTGMIG